MIGFFETLFGQLRGWIELRFLDPDAGPPKRRFVETPEQATREVERLRSDRVGIFVGVATRRDPEAGGGKDNLGAVCTLWADVDFHGPDDAASLDRALSTFPLAPSTRVNSGGGQHLYWALEEPFALNKPEAVEEFEATLRGLADVLGADRAATDASRILRVPGTVNFPDARKRERGRVDADCTILEETGLEYTWAAFEDFTARGRELRAHSRAVGAPEIEAAVPERIRAVLEVDTRARARFKRDSSSLRDRSNSGIDFALALQLARIPTLSHDDVEQAIRASRDTARLDHKHDGYFVRTVETAFASVRPQITADPERDRPAWLRAMLRASTKLTIPVERMELLAKMEDLAPRWPSTLRELDARTGGFYGEVILAGAPGVGKSMLAIASALEARRAGWDVAYFNAELDARGLAVRVQRYLNETHDRIERFLDGVHFYALNPGCSIDEITAAAALDVGPETTRLLIVIDSVNSFADLSAQAAPSAELNVGPVRRAAVWAMACRRATQGAISFLLVSELNARGETWGRLDWKADVVVRLEAGDVDDQVQINVVKGREGGRGDLGPHLLDWRRGRLERI